MDLEGEDKIVSVALVEAAVADDMPANGETPDGSGGLKSSPTPDSTDDDGGETPQS